MCDDAIIDPYKRMDALLRNSAATLQAWGQHKVGNVKLMMRVASWVIQRLDIAQENRALHTLETLAPVNTQASVAGHGDTRENHRQTTLQTPLD